MPEVVADVEVGIIDPDRPTLAEGDVRDPLSVPGNAVEPRGDVRHEFLVRRGRPLEYHARADVHVSPAALQVKERRVKACEPIRIRHPAHRRGGPRKANGADDEPYTGLLDNLPHPV